MRKKVIFIAALFFVLFPLCVKASSFTCEYKPDWSGTAVYIDVFYKYATPISYEVSDSKYNLENIDIANEDIVDSKTGEMACPDVIMTRTTIAKQRWKLTFTKDLSQSGTKVSGIIKNANYDDKEKANPISHNHECVYKSGTDSEYGLLWDGERVVVNLKGSRYNNFCDTNIKSEFTAGDFQDKKCPTIYDQIVARAEQSGSSCKGQLIISKNPILTPDDKPAGPGDVVDVDINPTRSTKKVTATTIKPDYFDTNCADFADTLKIGGLIIFFIKILLPLVIIVRTSIDLLSVVTNGDSGGFGKKIKKLGISLVAAILIFFVPTIVNVIFDVVINKRGVDYSTSDIEICQACLFEPFSGKCISTKTAEEEEQEAV